MHAGIGQRLQNQASQLLRVPSFDRRAPPSRDIVSRRARHSLFSAVVGDVLRACVAGRRRCARWRRQIGFYRARRTHALHSSTPRRRGIIYFISILLWLLHSSTPRRRGILHVAASTHLFLWSVVPRPHRHDHLNAAQDRAAVRARRHAAARAEIARRCAPRSRRDRRRDRTKIADKITTGSRRSRRRHISDIYLDYICRRRNPMCCTCPASATARSTACCVSYRTSRDRSRRTRGTRSC